MPKITVAGGPSSALGQAPEAAPDPEWPDPGREAAPAALPAPAAPAARAVPSLSGQGGVTVPKAGAGGA